MEKFLQDFRYGLRVLAKSKIFTIAVVFILALGIGANTTIFTVLNAIFLQPLPMEKPSEIVSLFTLDGKNSTGNRNSLPVSFPNYKDYRDQNTSFTAISAFAGASLSLIGQGEPRQLNGLIVTGNYFDVLGVKALIGRTFLPEEDQTPGLHPVIVLSHNVWKTQFGAKPEVIGSQITLNATSYTIIGVTPANFRGTFAIGSVDFFVPMMMHDQVFSGMFKQWFDSRRALLFNLVGRLKPNVTIEQAQAEIKTIASQLAKEHPKDNDGRTITLIPLTESTINPNQRDLFIRGGALLMAVVGLVLLIACANIANLLLIRANIRRREVAIRIALGASAWRLFQQFMIESILLSTVGGIIGLGLAVWGRDLLWSYRPIFIQADGLDLSLDLRVLVFTFIISLVTGVIFGIIPTLQATRSNLVIELKEKTAPINSGNKLLTLRNILVIAQIAFSLIALISASLFLRSLINAQSIDPGFETKKVFTISFELNRQNYSEVQGKEFFRNVQSRVQSLPGVKSVTVATNPPLGGGFLRSVFPEGGDPQALGKGILTTTNNIGTKFFETLNIPILQGRDFNDTDRENALGVAIINEAMVKRFWPGQDAIGKRFRFFGDDSFTEVIGIVKDTKQVSLGEEPNPCAYIPIFQRYTNLVTLYVQSKEDPKTILGTVRSEVQSLDSNLPLTNINTVSEIIGQSLWAARMSAILLVFFGLVALVLAAVGIYGILAYSVNQRTQEIGVRMALGAKPFDILKLVLSQAMLLVMIGIVLGTIGGLFLARLFAGLLFGVSAFDPITFIIAPLILALTALLASYIPAYRATKVDPLVALRYE
ncbi:MAG: ABC transporter permease [Blastocatellia bacterium]